MAKAIRIHETGDPEVFCWEDVDLKAPGPGEVLLRQTAVGLLYRFLPPHRPLPAW